LNAVELRTEVGFDKHPWLSIYFEVANKTADGKWRPKRVRISYHGGRIESRSIETEDPDGSFTWKTEEIEDEVAAEPKKDTVTKELKIAAAKKVDAVYWTIHDDRCSVQIRFPPLPDAAEQPEHASTDVWLLKADGMAIARRDKPRSPNPATQPNPRSTRFLLSLGRMLSRWSSALMANYSPNVCDSF
jgi:hypothetical protein